jgi:hypothetical protein
MAGEARACDARRAILVILSGHSRRGTTKNLKIAESSSLEK